MKPPKKAQSLPLTITLGSILVVTCLALTTLWNIVLIYNHLQLQRFGESKGMSLWIILGVGCFLFLVIITGVILFIVFMARQILLNQMQTSFIDSVTHEFKTPLTSLKLHLQTLKRHDLDPAKKADFLNTMLEDVERLEALVHHVLEAAKLDHLHRIYHSEPIRLRSLLEECRDVILKRYDIQPGAIALELEEIPLQSDALALQLVFINLLDNAVKYAQTAVRVRVSASIPGPGKVCVVIQDNGIGLAKGERKKIFRRFYRGPHHAENQPKGSGLGLFIVQQTVHRLKGRIQVLSSGPDQGCAFIVTLPAVHPLPGGNS